MPAGAAPSPAHAPTARWRTGSVPSAGSVLAAATAGTPPAVVRWLGKATFGFTLAELAAFDALGSTDEARWNAWLDQQLAPNGIDDGACDARLTAAGYQTLGKSLQALWSQHHGETESYYLRMLPLYETEQATLIRAVYSRRQLHERMVGFWHDHFSVFGGDYDCAPVFVHYDRDVIRAHAFGNFRSMLGAVARSTAMMYYLDNYASRGANFNENYARELLELHTLGAENYYGPGDPFEVPCLDGRDIHCEGTLPAGYVDNDVYEAAAALTGWTIRNGHWQFPNENDGTFVYRAEWHQHSNKFFLGRYFPANQPAMADGEQVLDRLCEHPGTARFIAGKLCRRFVGESASASLIDSVAATFLAEREAPDQNARVLRAVLASAEFKAAWGDGMKRPFEAAVAALRGLGADFTPQPDNTSAWTTTEEFFSLLQQTGHRPFRWGPPNGYPDTRRAWGSTGALAMTLKLVARLPELRQDRNNTSSPYLADILAQTKAVLPDPAQRTATAIIDYWCARLLGWQPQPLAGVATAFLRQNAGAGEPLDLDTEEWRTGDLKRHYTQSRLRTAVGMLLMSPDHLRR